MGAPGTTKLDRGEHDWLTTLCVEWDRLSRGEPSRSTPRFTLPMPPVERRRGPDVRAGEPATPGALVEDLR